MTDPAHRDFKNRLYGQFARLGKALASPHRLELLDLLAQSERTVDALAADIGMSLANASQHLQALRRAGLVESRKQGVFVYYRLADPSVWISVLPSAPWLNASTRSWIGWFAITLVIAPIRNRSRCASCSSAPGRRTS